MSDKPEAKKGKDKEPAEVVVMNDGRCQCAIASNLSLHERQALADELRRAIMRL